MKPMKRTKTPKPKKGAWFIPVRGSYLPASWQAWALYVPYLYYLVATLVLVIQSSATFAEISIRLVPYWVAGVVAMTWVAKQKS